MSDVLSLAYDEIAENLPFGIVILDSEKNIWRINLAAQKLLGMKGNPASGTLFSELADVYPTFAESIASSLSGNRNFKYSLPESERTLSVHVIVLVEQGEVNGWLVKLWEADEKNQTGLNSNETQETYYDVLESLQDAYFEANHEGVLTFINQAFVKAIGLTRKDELIGKHFRHITGRKSIRSVYENFKKVFETNQAVEPFDYIYRGVDGAEYESEIVASPILKNGKAIGTRGIVRDISVRVRAEEMLRQAKEAAEFRAKELAAINRVSTTVSRSLDMQEVLQSVCRELTSIFKIRNAGIGLLTPDKKSIEIVAFHTVLPTEKSVLGMVLPLEGNAASREAMEMKKTIVIQDAQTDSRTRSVANTYAERGTKAIMIVPLLTRGEAIGSFGLPALDPDYVFTEFDIQLAETIASQIAGAVDNARLYNKVELALGVAENDLEIGRQIQSGFFPEELPRIPGWEIDSYFQAARQVSGDFYDIYQFKNSTLTAFIVADVCDKGVGAALFMVLFRSLLRAFSETRIDRENVQEQLLNIIVNTNNYIAMYHGKSNMFATIFFGILDPENGDLYYVNCGHEPPIHLDMNGAIVQRLMPTGPAAGLFPDMNFEVKQIQIREGDFVVGFTDGTTDAKNSTGKLFSEERLVKTVGNPWTSILSMVFELTTELKHHIGEQPQFDDITLISFRRMSSTENAQHAICRAANLEHLEDLRNFVVSAATYCGLEEDDVFAFKLAVDELCVNIIQYGYEGQDPGWISLFFTVENNTARLSIRDDGKYFSMEEAGHPDVDAGWEEREIGGLGIYFVKELIDRITYNRIEESYNLLVLEKELSKSRL